MWVFHQASAGPSQQAQPALGPQMPGGISLQSWELGRCLCRSYRRSGSGMFNVHAHLPGLAE